MKESNSNNTGEGNSGTRIERILGEVLKQPTPEARERCLAEACGGDANLRAEIESLLAAHTEAGDFLERPREEAPAGTILADDQADTTIERAGMMIGRYKLLEQIGEGGFGVVYMAEQVEPIQRKVALKIVKAGMDTREVIARFEAERQALALMDHPNIAHVLDAGATQAGRPYFVMELVKGIPITDFCDQKKLSPNERLDLFMKVCQAVQHAHQKGIIHRDIKPSNVLVTLHDGEPVPKVIDFGVAKALGQRLTEKTLFTGFTHMLGTPAYMSPEQAELAGLDIDTRSDIYSLGVLLYELLTGVTPLDRDTLARVALDEVRRMIQETEPQKPSTRVQTLGDKLTDVAIRRHTVPPRLVHFLRGDLDWIVMKCLEKDRRRRYDTPSGLVMDVQRHLTNEPVMARRPSQIYRLHKLIRRNKLVFAAGTAVTAALILGLGLSMVSLLREKAAREHAAAGWEKAESEAAKVSRERDHALAAEREAERERNRAELLAAEEIVGRGQSKLEKGDSGGLWDLVKAFDLARHDVGFQNAIGRRWSTWHAYWDRVTIAVRPQHGTPSPDHLVFASVSAWPPNNTKSTVRLVDTLTGALVTDPLEHSSVVLGCAFSADGRLFATLTRDGQVHIWDRRTGSLAYPPFATDILGLHSARFSPCSRYLIAYTWTDSRVAFLRLRGSTGQMTLLDHRFPVSLADFSPDGELLAVAARPDLQFWRTSDRQPVGSPVRTTLGPQFAFSADGTRLAFNPKHFRGIGVLDTRTRQITRTLPIEVLDADTSAFSHDGRLLASFDGNCSLDVWDLESGTKAYPAYKLGTRILGGFHFSPDDSLLAVADVVGKVHVIRTRDGKVSHTLRALPWSRAAFLPGNVLAASGDSGVLFWDLSAPPLAGTALVHDALAHAVEFDRSGRHLAVGGENELRLWALEPSPTLQRVVSLPGRVTALTFSEADSEFVAFSDDGSLTMVEPTTGQTTKRGHIGHGYERWASLSPDCRKLALRSSRFGPLYVVNTRTGVFQEVDKGQGAMSVAFAANSTRMTVGTAGWRLVIYDTGAEKHVIIGEPQHFEGRVACVAFHPGGTVVAAYTPGGALHLYDSQTRRDIGSVRNTAVDAKLLRFSDDGSLLAVAGQKPDDGEAVELWHVDLQRGLFPSGVSLPSARPVWSIAFSPDNRSLVVGSSGTTQLWHLPSAPEVLDDLQSLTWAALGLRLNEQGKRIHMDPLLPSRDEEARARLTQEHLPSLPPLEKALALPWPKALEAVQLLASQHPETAIYQRHLGRLHAERMASYAAQGHYNQALAYADDTIRLGQDDPRTYYARALLCLGAGDSAGYQATCQAMAERYESSNDPMVLKWVCWAAALAPTALADYVDLIERFRGAASGLSGPDGRDCQFHLAAILTRAGQHREAAADLEQVDSGIGTEGAYVGFSPAYCHYLLAICHAQLGQTKEAREWYQKASELDPLIKPAETGSKSSVRWTRRLPLQMLRREAESMLNNQGSSRAPSP